MSDFIDTMEDDEIRAKLEQLRREHQDLDNEIDALANSPQVDFLQLQRMKKRKLALKDMIIKLENMLLPDIIA